MSQQMTFTVGGIYAGARRSAPIALSVFAYGLVFGVLARQTGLSLLEAVAMSALVCAGSSQFVVLELWASPLPIVTIVLTTLIVNLRHLLMGVSLAPWFAKLSPPQIYSSAMFLGDESWALAMGEFNAGRTNGAFMFGSGLLFATAWVGSTLTGYLLGTAVQDPAFWGLDFAFPAVIIGLLASMWKGRADILPWAVTAAVSVAAAYWLPGKWYILIGAIVGSLSGVLHHDD